jgi:hypothetical protein
MVERAVMPDDVRTRVSGERWDLAQHLYTVDPDKAPPENLLLVGELGIELADPMKLWVGVPTDMDATGRKLLYNSAASGGPGGGASVTISDTPPGSPNSGDLWWDSVSTQLFIRYTDPTSSQWVIANSGMAGYLPLVGGTMQGPLYLFQNPVDPMEAATKQYVDAQITGVEGAYLPLTGGALTGPLQLPNGTVAAPALQLGAADGTGLSRSANAIVMSVQGSTIFGTFAGAAQFYGTLSMLNNRITQVADATAATDGLNMRTGDARYLTQAQGDARYLLLTGGTLTGALTIQSATDSALYVTGTGSDWPAVKWNTTQAAGTAAGYFESKRQGKTRWSVEFGGTEAESGGNAGTNFIIHRFADDGSFIGNGLQIIRATGAINLFGPLMLAADPASGLQAATKQYVDNNTITPAAGDARWVNVAGDTMTGTLTINAPETGWRSFGANLYLDTASHYAAIWIGNASPAGSQFMIGNYSNRLDISFWANQSVETTLIRLYSGSVAVDVAATFNSTSQFMQRSSFNFGISLGSAVSGTPSDFSHHIDLYGAAYGFSVTDHTLNYIAGSGAVHDFYSATTRLLHLAPGGNVSDSPLTVGGLLTANSGAAASLLSVFGNLGGTIPALPGAVGSIGWNFNAGQAEVDFFNNFLGFLPTTSFAWFQQTAASTAKQVMTLGSGGNLNIAGVGLGYAGISGGGNLFGFAWVNGHADMYVDGNHVGQLANSGDLGNYLPLSGGTLSGALVNNGLLTANAGLSLGSVTSGITDLSHHISLWGGTYGFSVSSARLNYNVDASGQHVFVKAGVDIAVINSNGITLPADPTAAMHAATKQYVDNNTITPAAGDARWVNVTGDTMTGALVVTVLPTATSAQLQVGPPGVGNSLEGKLRFAGTFQSGADLGARLTASLRSGYSTSAWGNEYLDVWVNNGGQNDTASDANQNRIARFTVNGLQMTGALTVSGPATFNGLLTANVGLSFGNAVGGSIYDLSKHIALFSTSYGVGVSSGRLNLVAAAGGVIGLVIAGNDVLAAAGGNVNVYQPLLLAADPTAALQAATKQYSDRNKARGLVDVTSNAATPSVDQVDWAYLYVYGSPTAPSTITMPVASTIRLLWTINNTTTQPTTVRGTSGGTITIPSGASQAVWTDTAGIYPLYNAGNTRSPGDSTTFWATTAFVMNALAASVAGVSSFNGRQGAVVLTNADVVAVLPASTTTPVMDGTAAVGTGTTWARADHVHPTDTSRYAASNPSGYQTAAQVSASLSAYLPLTGGTLSGSLAVTNAVGINGAAGQWANLNLTRASGFGAQIASYTGAAPRWTISMADATAESGSNTGSNFAVSRFNDAGTYLDSPITINRASGLTNIVGLNVTGNATVGGSVTAGQGTGNAQLNPGGASNAGYVGFFNAAGTRQGYVGFSDGTNMNLNVDGLANLQVTTPKMTVTGIIRSGSYIMNAGNAIYWADNTNYYFSYNTGNGNYDFVANAALKASMRANGDFYAANSVLAQGGVFAQNDGNFGFFPNGANRQFSFAGSWFWLWNGSNGDLIWYNAGYGYQWYNRNDRWCYNNLLYVGGMGPYQDLSSDERVKMDIVPSEYGLAEVLRLRPVRYRRVFRINRKLVPDDREDIGFGAQQVHEIIPEAAIPCGIGFDGEVDPKSERLSFSTTPIVAALVRAVQELHAEVQELKARTLH